MIVLFLPVCILLLLAEKLKFLGESRDLTHFSCSANLTSSVWLANLWSEPIHVHNFILTWYWGHFCIGNIHIFSLNFHWIFRWIFFIPWMLMSFRWFRWISLNIQHFADVAKQTSTGWQGVPGRAIDGNKDGRYSSKSCSHTLAHRQPWWYVDMGKAKKIYGAKITNRVNYCEYG